MVAFVVSTDTHKSDDLGCPHFSTTPSPPKQVKPSERQPLNPSVFRLVQKAPLALQEAEIEQIVCIPFFLARAVSFGFIRMNIKVLPKNIYLSGDLFPLQLVCKTHTNTHTHAHTHTRTHTELQLFPK